jgi:transcriptional regulator with XRE-family HTH domain
VPTRKLVTPVKGSSVRGDSWQRTAEFRARFDTLLRETSGGSRTAFADLLGVSTSHVSKWCDGGSLPGAKSLERIAARTGVSIDWLLGFEVPQRRAERAKIGSLEAELYEVLLESRPQGAVAFTPRSSVGLLQQFAEEYWSQRWRGALEGYRAGLSQLGLTLLDLAQGGTLPDPDGDTTDDLTQTIHQIARLEAWLDKGANMSQVGLEDWRYLRRFMVKFPLYESPVAVRRFPAWLTTFGVPGGFGFAYAEGDVDHAWFLSEDGQSVVEETGTLLRPPQEGEVSPLPYDAW